MPIDFFFQSLAEDKKDRAIGIVFSGTGTDGTQGIRAIKAMEGITFAQDPQSAKHDGMPRSAIDSGAVDLILSPGQIAKELARIGLHPLLVRPSNAGRCVCIKKYPVATAYEVAIANSAQ